MARRSFTLRSDALERDAEFSPDRVYRYAPRRRWDRTRPRCAFVLLNPSTADERRDDPTIRRCIGFAADAGFGQAIVVNLFALRATEPQVLRAARDPIGPENDGAILHAALGASAIVIGWGAWGARFRSRADAVRLLLTPFGRRVFVLGQTRSGEPRHPLYLPARTRLRRERGA